MPWTDGGVFFGISRVSPGARRTVSSHVSDRFRTVRVTRNATVVRDYRVHAIVIFCLSPEDTRSKRFLGNGNGHWKCKLGRFNCSVYIGRTTAGYERRTRIAVVGVLSSIRLSDGGILSSLPSRPSVCR